MLAALLIAVNFNLSNAPHAQDNLSKLLTALSANTLIPKIVYKPFSDVPHAQDNLSKLLTALSALCTFL